jgi:predicted ArsR family transcriptional regulator
MDEERSRTLHRALADERRQRIVDELGAASSGVDAHELAARLDLHANTVRRHPASSRTPG